jgi:hypothetical protein
MYTLITDLFVVSTSVIPNSVVKTVHWKTVSRICIEKEKSLELGTLKCEPAAVTPGRPRREKKCIITYLRQSYCGPSGTRDTCERRRKSNKTQGYTNPPPDLHQWRQTRLWYASRSSDTADKFNWGGVRLSPDSMSWVPPLFLQAMYRNSWHSTLPLSCYFTFTNISVLHSGHFSQNTHNVILMF